MREAIVVSGLGIVTAIGQGVQASLQSLRAEKAGLSHLDFLNTAHANIFPFGEIKQSTQELIQSAGSSIQRGYTRTSLLGIMALQEAWQQASLRPQQGLRIGLINATTVGGMCEVEKYYFDLLEHPEGDYSEYADTIDCADCTHKIADHFGIRHHVSTISTACSSSANAIMLGERMLQQNMLDIAICGGTDALTRFTINGFNALKNIDREACRPFDANRNGLNLGEGAAYIILEKASQAKSRGAEALAILSGYSNFNESFHATAPNPEGEGAYQVMHRALQKAGLNPGDIDYINAHGTATLTNDESESNAMLRLFGQLPRFSSTKCYTGHTLAAAGAVEAVLSIAALQNGLAYANLNFETPMPGSALIPQLHFESGLRMRHVMSNSFAFGGNNASLIFSQSKPLP
ncbi:MAG: beta-ketoacyl-[acyl-carrier-protein] synthase family protein [Chitinophagaceae bacterium]|nr:beta-ketoacyl-[acyl-carrier-protein] synthase family protein [Chitinophagaceae bacterium]